MIRGYEGTMGDKYEFVLRVRDDSLALRVINPSSFLSIQVPIVKACSGWGGLYDKVMALPRSYLERSLGSPYKYMKSVNEDLVLNRSLANLSQLPYNTEQILWEALRIDKVPVERLHRFSNSLPFMDGRCQVHKGYVRGWPWKGDRWCIVDSCKDCQPDLPWNFDIKCTVQDRGRVLNHRGKSACKIDPYAYNPHND
jgi:hypothetical protein